MTAASGLAAAGATGLSGTGLQSQGSPDEGVYGSLGSPGARRATEQSGTSSTASRAAAMADGGAQAHGRGCNGTETNRTREGNRAGAHRDPEEQLGSLGDGVTTTNPSTVFRGRRLKTTPIPLARSSSARVRLRRGRRRRGRRPVHLARRGDDDGRQKLERRRRLLSGGCVIES